MILQKKIKSSKDILDNDREEALEWTGISCDFARLNEIIPLLLELYENEVLNTENITPFTIQNCIYNIHHKTKKLEQQNIDTYKMLWDELEPRGEDEFYDPIWDYPESDKYEFFAYNDLERIVIFSAFYYWCCFNPDFNDLEGLENFCLEMSSNNETDSNYFALFKKLAERNIEDNYNKQKEMLTKHCEGKKIAHYYLPPITSIFRQKGILSALERIDTIQQKKQEEEGNRYNLRQSATFLYYLLEQSYPGQTTQKEMAEILHLITGGNERNIRGYLEDIENPRDKTGKKRALEAKKRIIQDTGNAIHSLSTYIKNNNKK